MGGDRIEDYTYIEGDRSYYDQGYFRKFDQFEFAKDLGLNMDHLLMK